MDAVVYNAVDKLNALSANFIVDYGESLSVGDPVYLSSVGKSRNAKTSPINPFDKLFIKSTNAVTNITSANGKSAYYSKRAKAIDATHVITLAVGPTGTYAQVITVNADNTITSGVEVQVSAQTLNYVSLDLLDPTHAIAFCGGSARVLIISGTSISLGAELTGVTTNYYSPEILALDSTHAVLLGQPNSGYTGYLQVLTVSGTTITKGTETSISGFNNGELSYIDSTHFLLAYADGNVYTGKVRTVSVSGTTLTYNAVLSVGDFMGWPRITRLSSGLYFMTGVNSIEKGCVLSVSGTSVNMRINQATLTTKAGWNGDILAIDGNRILYVYGLNGNSWYQIVTLDLSQSTISPGVEIPVGYYLDNPNLCKITDSSCVLISVGSSDTIFNAQVINEYNIKGVFGIALGSGTGGSSVEVLLNGIKDGLTGLTAGAEIGTKERLFGVCLSTTKIHAKPYWVD